MNIKGFPGYLAEPIYDREDDGDPEGSILFAYDIVDVVGFEVIPPPDEPPLDKLLIEVSDDDDPELYYLAGFCCGNDEHQHYELVEFYETGGTSVPWDET